MIVLGIETSCDDTSAAIVRDGHEILSNIVSSQIDLHEKFGGIVPEVASRKHVELINPVINEALAGAGIGFHDLDGIAVTNRPGLLGALLIGVTAAKSLAAVLDIPLAGVHHLEGHISANYLVNPDFAFPFICLVVSGGHTDLILVRDYGNYQILGRTRDDAAGEAFDKSARVLGLGYPGGPVIDKLAKEGDPHAIHFTRAKIDNSLDFSFSGLKTAVIRFYKEHGSEYQMADIAASFQQAVIDMLVTTAFQAIDQTGIRRIAIAGGVAANSGLQQRIKSEAESRGIEFSCPPPKLCTDNAAMIACAGYHMVRSDRIETRELDTIASQPITG